MRQVKKDDYFCIKQTNIIIKTMELKRLLVFAITFFCLASNVFAQSDVLYLKNGSKIKGSVVEMDPTNGVKIQTSDGSLFVYSMSDVDRITKEDSNNAMSDKVSEYGLIGRKGVDFYWRDSGKNLTRREYETILDGELLNTFNGAQKQFKTGSTFLGLGLGCLAITVISLYSASSAATEEDFDSNVAMAQVFAFGADLGICLGCIFRGIGNGRLNWVKDTYNSGRSYSSTINFAPSLMMTAQRDMGVGASMVLTF